jgi:hypothetical protein
MATTFKNLADTAAAFDVLSARIDVLKRDLQFHTVRTQLQPRLDQILAGYNGIVIPEPDPTTGLIDGDALDAALTPRGANHVHALPESRRGEVKMLLLTMGRLP